MAIVNFLKKVFHVHHFNRPIVSKYVDFNNRRIIYECRCGKRKEFFVYRDDLVGFPTMTSHLISEEEFEKHLNNEQ